MNYNHCQFNEAGSSGIRSMELKKTRTTLAFNKKRKGTCAESRQQSQKMLDGHQQKIRADGQNWGFEENNKIKVVVSVSRTSQ
jgi:hypothetical protein